jgi:hypothetical protein
VADRQGCELVKQKLPTRQQSLRFTPIAVWRGLIDSKEIAVRILFEQQVCSNAVACDSCRKLVHALLLLMPL